jgi:hypothetical protein
MGGGNKQKNVAAASRQSAAWRQYQWRNEASENNGVAKQHGENISGEKYGVSKKV